MIIKILFFLILVVTSYGQSIERLDTLPLDTILIKDSLRLEQLNIFRVQLKELESRKSEILKAQKDVEADISHIRDKFWLIVSFFVDPKQVVEVTEDNKIIKKRE